MAYVQKTTPPPNEILTFSLKGFSGGMNNRSDQIQDNEGSVVLNLMFADDTILETRYGQKYYDDMVVDGEVVYIDEFRPYSDDNKLIRSTTTTMYIDGKEIPLQGKMCGVNHQGKYYFSDGKVLKVYGKFDDVVSTYVRLIGEPINDYDVYTISNPPTDYTPLTVEHVGGVKVIDYTNKKVWYEPCQNEIEDNFKGANVIPEMAKYIVSHNGRLYVSGNEKDDDNVFITDLQNPLYFAVSLPLQLPPTSEKITGMHVFDNSVVIGRQSDIYTIIGSSNNPDLGVDVFQLRRLNTHSGFASHAAIDIAHNYLIFLGNDGNVYAMQSSKVYERDLATAILNRTINLFAEPISLTKEDLSDATSFFYNDEWYLSMKDITMVYSYRHMAWVMYKGLNMRSTYGLDGEWLWGRPEGKIAMFDKENFFDFGEPYQTLWYSKFFDMGDPTSYKQFREFYLVAHTFDLQYSDIYVTFEVDYADIKDRVVISNQIARWGFAKWGDRFISRRISESVPFVIGRRGRSIRIKVTNNYDLDGVVNTFDELENYPEKREGLLVKVGSEGYYLYRNREWLLLEEKELNQRMKIHQINGDYEMRGKR